MKHLINWERGSSTPLQRLILILWIVGGQLFPVFIAVATYFLQDWPTSNMILRSYPVLREMILNAVQSIFMIPTFAGFYMVSKMILEDHICVRLWPYNEIQSLSCAKCFSPNILLSYWSDLTWEEDLRFRFEISQSFVSPLWVCSSVSYARGNILDPKSY